MSNTEKPTLAQPITDGAEAFYHCRQTDEVADDDIGEIEIDIVNLSEALDEKAAQVLFEAGLVSEANAVIELITAHNARNYAI